MSNATDSLNVSVPRTIVNQLGRKALFMLGAKDLTADGNTLRFRIGRNAKGVSHIFITLDASDTYTVEFRNIRAARKAPAGFTNNLRSSVEGVYVDSLHRVIEEGTGLYTRLF